MSTTLVTTVRSVVGQNNFNYLKKKMRSLRSIYLSWCVFSLNCNSEFIWMVTLDTISRLLVVGNCYHTHTSLPLPNLNWQDCVCGSVSWQLTGASKFTCEQFGNTNFVHLHMGPAFFIPIFNFADFFPQVILC